MSCTKKDKFVPIYSKKAHKGRVFIAPPILILGMVWRREVDFVPWPVTSGKEPGNH